MPIEIKDLTVKFRNGTKAVDGINMNLEKGIYGLLGENGAGKTTLMRVLSTILKPSEGMVSINGMVYSEKNYEAIQRMIGYLPQELGLYPNLTVRESLDYIGKLSGIGKNDRKKQIDFYLEKTSLASHQKKKNRQLSGGMKRRAGLVQALLHNPEVLIVDEPTTGLDPEERIRIRNLLVDFSKSRTVLFSTHVIEDLTATCNKLAVMKGGKLLFDGLMLNLLDLAKGYVWICDLQNEVSVRNLEEKYLISSRQFTKDGMQVKIISEVRPDVECRAEAAVLEDAYIYLTNCRKN